MSAAEKLKALDVKPELISLSAHPDLASLDVVDAKVYARLFNALPQIVAVVEAADILVRDVPSRLAMEGNKPNELAAAVDRALAALDEALT